jgi:hypothetical protein
MQAMGGAARPGAGEGKPWCGGDLEGDVLGRGYMASAI